MADDDSWLYGEDNDEVEEPEAATEEAEAVKGKIIFSITTNYSLFNCSRVSVK